ncbi:MAG: ECF-type sigma factor [Planctomycetota bacterium]
MASETQITQLVAAAGAGDIEAASELLPLVYDELRRIASSKMRNLAPGQTLQPTALVHEAYIKLIGASGTSFDSNPPEFENRAHFFFAASRAMKDILVGEARKKASLKRGGDVRTFRPDKLEFAIDVPSEDMLELEAVLNELEKASPRLHQIVLLRFFAGLTIPQIAEALGVSHRTVERDWRAARARVLRMLEKHTGALWTGR